MAKHKHEIVRRYRDRVILLILVFVPFIPELMIQLTAALATIAGCYAEQMEACHVGPFVVSNIIDRALGVAASLIVSRTHSALWLSLFYLAVASWLTLCYIVLARGWTRLSSRVLLGLVVALIFALLPYVGPMLAIANLARKGICEPSAGGGKRCMIFGGDISNANDAVMMGEPPLLFGGALISIGLFCIFIFVVVILSFKSSRSPRMR